MPRILYTVESLVDEVRSQLDESASDAVDTTRDILPALNRAQTYACSILARRYPEPLLKQETLTLVAGDSEYSIPENAFEDRVQKVEISLPNGEYREVQQISYRDISDYESTIGSPTPSHFCVVGRTLRFLPTPTGEYSARIWIIRNPEALVLPQGRITVRNTGSNYVVVDSAGSSLTTEGDQLGSYTNWVDGQTGEILGTLQIATLSENRIGFRSTPIRSTLLGRTVSGALSSISGSLDDYLAPIGGTCVPYYPDPVVNFLVQYAVAELTRKLGGASDTERTVLEQFEKQVERTWSRRETTLRVRKKSRNWATNPTRLWYR